VRNYKQLTLIATAVTLIATASVFADSRPTNETRERRATREAVTTNRTRSTAPVTVDAQRRDESRNSETQWREESRQPARGDSRETTREDGRIVRQDASQYRGTDTRSSSNRSSGSNRNGGNHNGDNRSNGNRSNGSYGNGSHGNGQSQHGGYSGSHNGGSYRQSQPYYAHGRVSNYSRYGGGYRVWVAGSPYPFYVPLAYWNPARFRVGVTIGLGGYYNPGGYYDYGYYGARQDAYSRGEFAGVVESVDYRRESFVVRNEDSGSYITVLLNDRYERIPRPGDVVQVRGDWSTAGYFRAYDVALLDRY
jgi:hypothetical protein